MHKGRRFPTCTVRFATFPGVSDLPVSIPPAAALRQMNEARQATDLRTVNTLEGVEDRHSDWVRYSSIQTTE